MNIVILSRNANLYSTERLVEEGEKRGHKVEVIDPLNCDIIIEKEKPTIYYKDRYLGICNLLWLCRSTSI